MSEAVIDPSMTAAHDSQTVGSTSAGMANGLTCAGESGSILDVF